MASGIVEKGNGTIFYNEVEFNGKYSTMARFMKDKFSIFPTYREVYLISAAVGFYLNKHETLGLADEKTQPSSIFPNELMKKRNEFRFIYRIIMLVNEQEGFTVDDYMNHAFRDDVESEKEREMIKENMKVFNSYACGGLEYLYRIFENQDSEEKVAETLYEFVHSVIIDCGFAAEEELPDFNPMLT